MTLRELADRLGAQATGPVESVVSEVTHDSRKCLPGSLFVAIAGARWDGNNFVEQAIERGAVAIMSERPCPANFTHAWLQVPDVRLALALAAAEVFDHPSRRLKLVGITGTNGKTTTAHLVDSMFRAAAAPSAIMGTITYRLGDQEVLADRTTPEASDIQRFLSRAADQGVTHAVMEVSSHALELKRVHGSEFAVAVYTNLTPEHLDYHGTMDQYFAAKRKLFEGVAGPPPKGAVINLDDPRADDLLNMAFSRSSLVLTYGFHADADVRAQHFTLSLNGLSFVAGTPVGNLPIASPLVGKPHVYNILAAMAVGLLLDFDVDAIVRGINNCPRVPGRFEVVDEGQDFAVVIDYAHTHDALQNSLETARALTPHRIITLFGCGGDRDPTKRAPMGEVAGRLSDLVIVTSDNPRSEDPQAIIEDIEVGLHRVGKPYLKVVDRREAIRCAIQEARPGDLVLLAGKGHETYQVLKDRTIPFDDRDIAREVIRQRLGEKPETRPEKPEIEKPTNRTEGLGVVSCLLGIVFWVFVSGFGFQMRLKP
jgi:UDP-N-acetylmuramyl-tripeptide synthetase